MTRITNADQVLILLRAHLERAQKARRNEPKSKVRSAETTPQRPMERVQDLAAANALTGDELKRALVSGLLAEEFGPRLAADPKFQKIVDEVLRMVQSDDRCKAAVQLALHALTGAARATGG